MTQHRRAPALRPLLTLGLVACTVIGLAAPADADDDGRADRDRGRVSDRDRDHDTGYVRAPGRGDDDDHNSSYHSGYGRGYDDGYGNGYDHDHGHDHDRARRLLEQGDIRPLSAILAQVAGDLPGRIIATEFEREAGTYVYEFKVVDTRGRVREVYVDATTGRILKIEDDD